jgi:hypothetical protein
MIGRVRALASRAAQLYVEKHDTEDTQTQTKPEPVTEKTEPQPGPEQ